MRNFKFMQYTNYGESISDAVAFIGDIPSLEELDASRIKLAVVLRLLRAAGWDVFDVSQVAPDYPTCNGKVDFALMAPNSQGAEGPATPQLLVIVKPFDEDLDSGRNERRMVAHCARLRRPWEC